MLAGINDDVYPRTTDGGEPKRTVVIDVVALTKHLISLEFTPNIHRFVYGNRSSPPHSDHNNTADDIGNNNLAPQNEPSVCTIEPVLPALTCSSQTTYLTGCLPGEHGIVGNGFYDAAYGEIKNWHQSAQLVQRPRIFETLKKQYPNATTFSNCWWFPMNDPYLDYVITPRPQYLADGGKKADCYTVPSDLRETLQQKLGTFPLYRFWGPMTSIVSSEWIAKASMMVDQMYRPTLSLVYLPHLDYCLQKYGMDFSKIGQDLKEIDEVVQSLIDYYQSSDPDIRIVLLSEYGIQPVSKPVHINRHLRSLGWISVRKENGGETLDCGQSKAFALSDHEIAHVYVQDPKNVQEVKQALTQIEGIAQVFTPEELNHYYHSFQPEKRQAPDPSSSTVYHDARSGQLTCIASQEYWFTYYYFDPKDAPDFASTINIHRKPGYDPTEMFFRFKPDCIGMAWLFLKIFMVYLFRLRRTIDATPLDRSDEIKGSHGSVNVDPIYKPVLATNTGYLLQQRLGTTNKPYDGQKATLEPETVHDVILDHLTL